MMSNVMVINFGCPRTGTTHMEHLLREGSGYVHRKMGEGHACHPAQSDIGLLGLAEMFADRAGKGPRRLVFVRTVRHPADIIGSWAAMPTWEDMPYDVKQRQIWERVQYIRRESALAREQFDRITEEKPWKFLQCSIIAVRYEDIGESPGIVAAKMAGAIGGDVLGNADRFAAYIAETWGIKSVREGRLSKGLSREANPDLLAVTRKHLKAIMRADGYDA